MRYSCTPRARVKIVTVTIQNASENLEKLSLSYILDGNLAWYIILENSMDLKNLTYLHCNTTIALLGVSPREFENTSTRNPIHNCLCHIFKIIAKKLKTAQLPCNK